MIMAWQQREACETPLSHSLHGSTKDQEAVDYPAGGGSDLAAEVGATLSAVREHRLEVLCYSPEDSQSNSCFVRYA